MSRSARISIIALGVLTGFLSLEIAVRFFSVLGPTSIAVAVFGTALVPQIRPDKQLGYRLTPGYPEIDRRGWRNASALGQADIVALGDSQTYGYPVKTEEAWPQLLGPALHRSVYQMAAGGYGPGQYLLLFDEAAALRPKVMLAAYYLGNDLFDSYDLVYHSANFKNTAPNPQLDMFASQDPRIRESIRQAEGIDPGLLRFGYLSCDPDRRTVIPNPHFQQAYDILTSPPLSRPPPRQASPRRLVRSLLNTSAVYRITRMALGSVVHRAAAVPAVEDYGPPVCVHFHDGQLKTVLTAGQRLILLDRTDPRIVEGERISLSVFRGLAERCRRAGIRFYAVLIPSKETAFRSRAEASLRDQRYLRMAWVPPG